MRDIIALALKSGFVSRTYGDNSGEIAITCVSNLTPLNSELQRYSELLEAEIQATYLAINRGNVEKIAELEQVMIAAAEEIHEHWQAHCDDEGCGPQNLMYRLENGIATNYPGYSAGAFQTLTAQNAKLMEALEGYKNALSKACGDDEESINNTLESVGALTPQPEKEGEEKDPHHDLLDSWGPSA